MDTVTERMHFDKAMSLLESGDVEAAERALLSLEQVEPTQESAPMLAVGLSLLANLRSEGGAGVMKPLLQRAHQICENFTSIDPHVGAEIALLLAPVLLELGEEETAATILATAAARARQCSPPHAQVLTRALLMLAGLRGDSDEAQALLAECVDLAQDAEGVDPALPLVLSQQAQRVFSAGAPKASQRLLERAVTVAEENWDPGDPSLATLLTNLAILQMEISGSDQHTIEENLNRALGIAQLAFGGEDPEVARVLSVLARLFIKTGRAREALPLLGKALWIHQENASELVALADVHCSLGIALALALAQGQDTGADADTDTDADADTDTEADTEAEAEAEANGLEAVEEHFAAALELLVDEGDGVEPLRRFIRENRERFYQQLSSSSD
ncbi:MAG: hypothetical protein A2341_22460 [Deltaproteobacteria bacterium RIFOXYB12_FULL_58_9]|nr:MAG: hypothetical protein A2341_22460 [Deltaproteobacteria bacterium RIFOXYB12_FULL_58_9]